MSFKDDFVREKLFLLGFALIAVGVLIFFGLSPRGQDANPVGAAWPLAGALVGIGLVVLAIDYYLNR